MKTITAILGSTLLLLSANSNAQYFCISNQGKPHHCEAGDIILVKPTMMPRVCDFSKQIKRMPKAENKAEYLCSYTGTILAIKELRSQLERAAPVVPVRPQPKRNNKIFNNMPFFK